MFQVKRIVSFLKDEPIVGGYLNGFYLLIVGFLMIELKKKNFLLIFLILILFILAILLTGERSNTIKAFLGLSFFILLIDKINLKKKIVLLSATIILVFLLISNYHYLKIRFNKQIQTYFMKDSVYLLNYKSGFKVFKNNKILGVGNKNYRVEACKPENVNLYRCQTHPHQVYLELLSEHGILGTSVILFILYKLIFSKVWTTIKEDNYIRLGTLIYMVLVFTPLLPSGAFFNNYMLTIFCLNLSIFYALDKKSNIFRDKY